MQVKINLSRIKDRETFHAVFAEVMGFPEFYGKNMDAWIDCMSYIDEPGAGMSRVTVKEGEVLEFVLEETEQFMKNHMKLFETLLACTASVNRRFIEVSTKTRIAIVAT